jgi:uncharacterized membrane protein
MKTADIEKIHEAGLITAEQRDRIIAHFNLKDEGSRFLTIISFIGGVLVAAGVVLLISAHWNEIPAAVKIALGLLLMLGTHAAGWRLREGRGRYPKTGEALQFIGSALFLANIALVGQIYNLHSRLPDAFLLWLAGIAALPWLLRSKAQFVLMLGALAAWFGCEINERTSLIYCGNEAQMIPYALLGLIFLGAGYWLRRSAYPEFAGPAEKTGALGLLLFAYPLTWAGFLNWPDYGEAICRWLVPVMALLAAGLAVSGLARFEALNQQWRRVWMATLTAAAGLLVAAFFLPHGSPWLGANNFNGMNAVATMALFVFCLIQIQAGLQQRSRFLVNLGVTFIALDIISAYFGLFGTMAFTGLMFVVSGVFLILFGVFLEKKRRDFIRKIKTSTATEAQS